jgi:hypothetical protein
MRTSTSTHGRLAIALMVAVACTTLLAGCQSTKGTPSAGASSSSTPSSDATPVTIACDKLITADQLASFTPALTSTTSVKPATGSHAALAVTDHGVACDYRNPATGNTVTVAVSRPAPDALTVLKGQAAEKSNVVPTYGTPPKVLGYFAAPGNAGGEAQAFAGAYWITATSKDWAEPGDGTPVMDAVLANLGL